jgi:hypothetical protein
MIVDPDASGESRFIGRPPLPPRFHVLVESIHGRQPVPLRKAGDFVPPRERDGISREQWHRWRVFTRHTRQGPIEISGP